MLSTQLAAIHSEDVLLSILSFLPVPDLARCAAVCKRWHEIVTGSTHLWKGKRYTSKKSPRTCAETRAVLFALPPLQRADVELGYQCYVYFSYPRLSLSVTDISDLGTAEEWQKVRCVSLSTNLNVAESFFSPGSPVDFAELQKVDVTERGRSRTRVKPGTSAECAIGSALQLCPNLGELSVCVESLSADYLNTVEALGRLRTLRIECDHLEKLAFLWHCSEVLEELELECCYSVPSASYADLRHLGNLRRLRLHCCCVDEGDLEVAAPGLTSLVSLHLSCCDVSDLSFLRHCRRLHELRVETDRTVQWGARLTGLRHLPDGILSLHLSDDTVTADELSEALPRLPLLGELSLRAKLDHLGFLRGCPQLRRLRLDNSSWPDAAELSNLQHLSRLETLDLTGRSVDVSVLCGAIPSLPRLDTLSLGYRQNVAHLLRECPRLQSLSLLDKYGNLCDTNKLWKYDCGKFVCKFVPEVV